MENPNVTTNESAIAEYMGLLDSGPCDVYGPELLEKVRAFVNALVFAGRSPEMVAHNYHALSFILLHLWQNLDNKANAGAIVLHAFGAALDAVRDEKEAVARIEADADALAEVEADEGEAF